MRFGLVVIIFFQVHAALALEVQETGGDGSRWVLGKDASSSSGDGTNEWDTCDSACAREGLVCNEESKIKQADINSLEKMKGAWEQATGSSWAEHFSWSRTGEPENLLSREYEGSPFMMHGGGDSPGYGYGATFFAKREDLSPMPTGGLSDKLSTCSVNSFYHMPLCWCVQTGPTTVPTPLPRIGPDPPGPTPLPWIDTDPAVEEESGGDEGDTEGGAPTAIIALAAACACVILLVGWLRYMRTKELNAIKVVSDARVPSQEMNRQSTENPNVEDNPSTIVKEENPNLEDNPKLEPYLSAIGYPKQACIGCAPGQEDIYVF